MDGNIIEVSGLSKRYRIGETLPYYTLRDEIVQTLTAPFRRRAASASGDNHIWALRDVSFTVKEGEVVGIIGRNGAGKSTLLTVLSRITEPTSGRITLGGTVASLLEVGTGFHPELTGRENVLLNGALLGMTRREIHSKFDEIVAFAEIEKFLDTPVKRYSSGMYVRLAFAVAAHLDPEILIVDEVLAVGDVAFQKKCLGKMGDVARGGRTILFVSHNMGAVQQLCTRALVLAEGTNVVDAPADVAVTEYVSQGLKHNAVRVWPDPDTAPGDDVVRLRAVRVLDGRGNPCYEFTVRDAIYVQTEFQLNRELEYLNASFYFSNERGELLFTSVDDTVDRPDGSRRRGPGVYRATCRIPGDLMNDGVVFVQAALTEELVVHALERDVVSFLLRDDLDRRGARGNYRDPAWPRSAVRPRLEWEAEVITGPGHP
jgi:lipopolysaccharide transport system ATP-binding protein